MKRQSERVFMGDLSDGLAYALGSIANDEVGGGHHPKRANEFTAVILDDIAEQVNLYKWYKKQSTHNLTGFQVGIALALHLTRGMLPIVLDYMDFDEETSDMFVATSLFDGLRTYGYSFRASGVTKPRLIIDINEKEVFIATPEQLNYGLIYFNEPDDVMDKRAVFRGLAIPEGLDQERWDGLNINLAKNPYDY